MAKCSTCKVFVALVALMMLCGCAVAEVDLSGMTLEELINLQSEIEAAISLKAKPAPYPIPDEDQEFTILKEYRYIIRRNYYLGVVVRNDSGRSVKVEADIMLYNDKDELVGIKKQDISVVAPGKTFFLETSNDIDFAYAKYFIDAERASYDEGDTSIELTYQVSDGKIYLFANNNGKYSVEFLNYHLIVLNDGQVVGRYDDFLMDSNYEIRPGNVEMCEIQAKYVFDEIRLYYDCRIDR